MPKALIIVPSQGDDVGAFVSVALALKKDVYGGSVTIVQTVVTEVAGGALSVALHSLGGGDFSFQDVSGVSTALTISHGFSVDGPNLAYHSGGYQPWGTEFDETGVEMLSVQGESFWKEVGRAIRAGGKIILVGCFMGSGVYASNVAAASGKTVYASTSLFGAGDVGTTVPYVRDIERGVVRSPMKKF